MAKLNPIKPTMREKKRYICFRVNKDMPEIEVRKSILSRIKRYIGEKNYALARPQLVSKTYQKNKGIISCNNKQYLDVRFAITLTEKINDQTVKVEVPAVSGMINKAKEKLNHI